MQIKQHRHPKKVAWVLRKVAGVRYLENFWRYAHIILLWRCCSELIFSSQVSLFFFFKSLENEVKVES